eukprot:452962-Karenia_brevis.AAC.1
MTILGIGVVSPAGLMAERRDNAEDQMCLARWADVREAAGGCLYFRTEWRWTWMLQCQRAQTKK